MSYFKDEIIINIKSGNGGDGIVSFRREKFVPKGGPDGGDGGDGGDIYFEATNEINTLSHLTTSHIYKAGNGEKGKPKNCSGKKGKDLIIKVPIGSQLIDENGNIIYDFVKEEKILILKGGKGGKGNQHFATPVNQSPRICTRGLEGKSKKIKIELKFIADVALVGFPNSGKSTLLKTITNSNPKIAPYPFTTLYPNLGTFSYDGKKYFIIADIPGLIEGASLGKGLGIRFLKHIERTKVLLFLIDSEKDDLIMQYKILLQELENFDKYLLKKERIISVSKIDLNINLENVLKFEEYMKKLGYEIYPFSSFTKENLENLKKAIYDKCMDSNI
ncbi:MAG: GTPase ObgE [Spirochaetes bacterium]|nr:GTPase ObgE [Spirochaetota bacterium]